MQLRPRFPAVVDEITVRLVAGAVLCVAVTALVSGQWWLYAALAVDFVLRATWGPQASPVARWIVMRVRPLVRAAPRPTPGAPKRFAATIGAALTLTAAIAGGLYAADGPAALGTIAFAIGAVMVAFPALESVAGVCVGCLLFAGLIRAGLVPQRVCLECADVTRRWALPTAATES